MSDGVNLYKKLPNLFCDSYLAGKVHLSKKVRLESTLKVDYRGTLEIIHFLEEVTALSVS